MDTPTLVGEQNPVILGSTSPETTPRVIIDGVVMLDGASFSRGLTEAEQRLILDYFGQKWAIRLPHS